LLTAHAFLIRAEGDRRDQVGDSSNDSSLKRSQFAPPDKIDKVIDEFLTKCRPRFQELVNSVDDIPSFLPSWEPDPSADEAFKRHTSKLCIPAIGENRPSLLLHRLGEEKTKLEHERNLRIPGVFRGQEHTYVASRSLLNTFDANPSPGFSSIPPDLGKPGYSSTDCVITGAFILQRIRRR